MPLAGAPLTVRLPRREPFDTRRFLIGDIPLWAGIVALIAVVVTFGIVVFGLKRDWADSAWIAALVALTGAAIIFVAGIVILVLRRFQWLTLGLSALLLVALSVSGILALTGQLTIHWLQARALENNQQWQASIREYWLAGEQTPNASNVARVHLEWGEQLLRQGSYSDAVDQFNDALEDDTSSMIANRANKDLYRAFTAWLQVGPPDDGLRAIATFLDTYLSNPLCESDCQHVTRPLAAQAIYLYGDARLKQDRNSFCSEIAADYQDLLSRYAGTEGAQRAGSALAAPVTFTAWIYNFPAKHIGSIAHLSRHVYPEQSNNVSYISRDYAAPISAWGQDVVQAVFKGIPPGNYNFSFDFPPGSRYEFWYWYRSDQTFNPYSAVVPPLCGTGVPFYYGGT
jgi:hypothetical protein